MSLGRKPKSSQIESEWQRVFFASVGVYTQSIIVGLETLSINGNGHSETGKSLLEKIRGLTGKSLPAINETEIPFDIPSHWVWCRLGEIIEFTNNLNIESTLSQDTLIDYVDIDAIDNKQFKIREVKTKPVSELSSRARRVLKKGFVIYSLVRPYLNNLAIIDEDRNNFIGSTGFAVFNGIIVNNEYLKFLLLTDFVRNRYSELLSGFNSPSITQEQFVNTLIPLPPIAEQDRIVRFLNDLESNSLKETPYFNEAIERRVVSLQNSQLKGSEISTELDYQLALVKKLRQAYLREAMQGKLVPQDPTDEPAEILLEKIKAEKEKLVAEKRIKRDKPLPPISPEELPFEIPSNWTWCRLPECSINRDGERVPISLPERQRRAKIYDYYGASGNIDKIDDFTHDGRFLLIGEDGANLVARSTPVAFIAVGKFWVNNHAHVIETVDEISTDYLCNYINGISLKPYITGGFQPKLSQGNLNLITVPLPPLAEQERIVAKLEKLMKFCDELEANIKEGITNTDRLLQTALREALEPKL